MNDMSLGGHHDALDPDDIGVGCAEIRRRIDAIGAQIALLRQEADRLLASADARYPAIALLERPDAALDQMLRSRPAIEIVPDRPAGRAPLTAPEPPWGSLPTREGAVARSDANASDPNPRARTPAAAATGECAPVSSPDHAVEPASDAAETAIAWVPVPADPTGDQADDGALSTATVVSAPTTGAPTVEASGFEWAPLDDDDEAAFDRFFSTDLEPEPSQRWLLS